MRIAPRHRQSRATFINAQTGRQWPFSEQRQQEATGACAKINQAPGFVCRQQGQCRLNQRLAIRARVKHGCTDMKPPPPKLLMSDNFGDRHAGKAQGKQRIRVIDQRCGSVVLGLHGQFGWRQTAGMFQQQTRVKRRRLIMVRVQTLRHAALQGFKG